MNAALVILCVIAWCFSGVASLVYWWTSELDLDRSDAVVCSLAGCVFGPLSFLLGWLLHGDHGPPKVLIKKRGSA